jgi:hypothetical protein
VSSASRSRALAGVVRAAVLAAAVAAAGCYEDTVGIDPSPLVPIDTHLVGTWRCVGPSVNENAFTIVVDRATERTYALTYKETGEADDHLNAFISKVKDATFLNVSKKDQTGPPRWNVLRVVLLTPDVAELRIVEDVLLTGVAPAALHATLERQLANPKLFDERPPAVCVRSAK